MDRNCRPTEVSPNARSTLQRAQPARGQGDVKPSPAWPAGKSGHTQWPSAQSKASCGPWRAPCPCQLLESQSVPVPVALGANPAGREGKRALGVAAPGLVWHTLSCTWSNNYCSSRCGLQASQGTGNARMQNPTGSLTLGTQRGAGWQGSPRAGGTAQQHAHGPAGADGWGPALCSSWRVLVPLHSAGREAPLWGRVSTLVTRHLGRNLHGAPQGPGAVPSRAQCLGAPPPVVCFRAAAGSGILPTWALGEQPQPRLPAMAPSWP